MDPIAKLMEEHRTIERALDALAAFVTTLDAPSESAREDLQGFVTFIREYADAYHHGKEEDMLFTAMADGGMPTDAGPIAVMLADHVQGRAYVAALGLVAGGSGPLSDTDVRAVRDAAAGYVELLRAHIQKEDQILYPMAVRVVSAEGLKQMAAQFTEYEGKHATAADALAAPFNQ